jgi:hypothetical protein
VAKLLSQPDSYLKERLTRRSRVLLINPPVQERRYHWIRWNQPSDLLRLSSWLKATCPGIEVRLFDFMLPDDAGNVPKHKVKETWTGAEDDAQLWHFGRTFDAFERRLTELNSDGWRPDLVVISSLTSYWHVSIEKLLIKLCTLLGKARRKATTICLAGNYPRLEPAHAQMQGDADVAFTASVDTRTHCPDFQLYLDAGEELPPFFALDIEDRAVGEHLSYCLAVKAGGQRKRGSSRPSAVTVAFFNDDVCSPASQLETVVDFARRHPRQMVVEGICGIEPASLTAEKLNQLKAANFQSLFVEHARLAGGRIDVSAYEPLLAFLEQEEHQKKSGEATTAWLERGKVTGFVAMGLPDDNLDELVRSTLLVNSFFQAVILKPHGYSPRLDSATELQRRKRWTDPYSSSPQWFPYVGNGSKLVRADYENLVRWQNVLNKRVKGATFDFLDDGVIAKLVRETVVSESWKRRMEAQ